MNATIHYVTEMVQVSTGKVVERRLWTIKGAMPAADLLKSVPGEKMYRGGAYRCTVTKSWVS